MYDHDGRLQYPGHAIIPNLLFTHVQQRAIGGMGSIARACSRYVFHARTDRATMIGSVDMPLFTAVAWNPDKPPRPSRPADHDRGVAVASLPFLEERDR